MPQTIHGRIFFFLFLFLSIVVLLSYSSLTVVVGSGILNIFIKPKILRRCSVHQSIFNYGCIGQDGVIGTNMGGKPPLFFVGLSFPVLFGTRRDGIVWYIIRFVAFIV